MTEDLHPEWDVPTSTLADDIMDIDESAEPELSIEQRVDWVAAKLIQLEAKIDNVTNGLTATYQGVSGLVTMLSAVQQVASMMPGGKRIAQAMMSAQSQNGAPNNGQ